MRTAFCCTFFSAFFFSYPATFMYLLTSNHQISETEWYSVYHVFRNIKYEYEEILYLGGGCRFILCPNGLEFLQYGIFCQ